MRKFIKILDRKGITANMVTFFRLVLLAIVAVIYIVLGPYAAAWGYAFGMLLDFIDGKIARFQKEKYLFNMVPPRARFLEILRHRGTSEWGARWDARCDKLYYAVGLIGCYVYAMISIKKALIGLFFIALLQVTRMVQNRNKPNLHGVQVDGTDIDEDKKSSSKSNVFGQAKAWVEAFFLLFATFSAFLTEMHYSELAQAMLIISNINFVLAAICALGSWWGHMTGMKLQVSDLK